MAITKEQKNEILSDLVEKFSKSKSVVFTDYRGLDVASVSDLRGKLREKGAEAKVAKKTLIKLAAKENKIDEIGDDILAGPVAATFSYEDELSGLKVLFKFSKENENLKLLGGVIDGKVVGEEEIKALAKLPGKEELLAKLIGSMNAPVSGMVGIMNNLVGGLVRVINAYKDTLPEDGSAPAEAPAEEKPAEEVPAAETTEPAAEEAPAAEESAPEEPKQDEAATEDAGSEEEDDLGEEAPAEEAEAPAEEEEKGEEA